ncbi:hypothetical protein [Arthrobacter sp. Hiyo1]|uniref:hypothetical protein n=1 Tax=Arthrobacter sp. Hiyo1 TaxID=1588020 RepID=UPI0011E4D4F4|nr:hypothetical protein [Arthrobacter sp. Hiyo1]
MGLDSYINSWLHNASYFIKEEMSSRAPEGVGGVNGQGLKHNIGIDIDPALRTAMIKPNNSIAYADAVETGSRPHRPPAGPDSSLAQWCEMKGLNVWAVAKSIELRGTKPHPYIEPTYQATKGPVAVMFSEGIAQYLGRMQAI